MAYTELSRRCGELEREYEKHFGVSFGAPFGADCAWTESDRIAELSWALERDTPFDVNSPRWPWSREPLPDGVIL